MDRVAYIDEVLDDRLTFSEEFNKEEIKVTSIDPIPDLASMVNHLLAENFDAIVVDYTLYASRPDIKYSGVELINEFWNSRVDFPAFIMTNNRDTDHVDDKIRPSFVFQKKAIVKEPGEIIRKLKKEIDYYRTENKTIEDEFNVLVEKRDDKTNTLTDAELHRLNELDCVIEKRLNKDKRFNSLIQDSENIHQLKNILNSAEELFKNLNS
jgi:hypothetical protein